MLYILFSSNHNIHKSSYGLYFWASDPLIERFYWNHSIKGSEAGKQRQCELLWMLRFDEKSISSLPKYRSRENCCAVFMEKKCRKNRADFLSLPKAPPLSTSKAEYIHTIGYKSKIFRSQVKSFSKCNVWG